MEQTRTDAAGDGSGAEVGSTPGDDVAREAWIVETRAALTLDEKAAILSGHDSWSTVAVPRLGIGSMRVTDGPNGARGSGWGRVTAACFPVGTALAASWDPSLLAEVGAALGDEARTKQARVLLGPTVNLHRSPLAGRNFECYSEDPLLTAELATAYVTGLQGRGVGACIKHFVANDSEFERHTISSEVSERTLRELYLLPFERTVRAARPWSVMAAYNRINGTYACEHRWLLVDVLADEWGFDGAVISDWGAVQSTAATVLGGCDLEMPGPARHLGERLVAAVGAGEVAEADVDRAVTRMLRTLWRAGAVDGGTERGEEVAVDRPEHRELARLAAVEGMVLLKNEPVAGASAAGATARPVLPLAAPADGDPAGAVRRIAVLGPNAAVGMVQGGGSSIVRPHYVVHPLEAIIERAGAAVTVVHASGGAIDRYQPAPDPAWFAPVDDAGRGLQVAYVDGDDPDGPAVATRAVRAVSWVWWAPPEGVADPSRFAARWTATLRPPASGPWTFGLSAIGRSRVLLDGEVVLDNWTAPRLGDLFFGAGSTEVVATVELEAGRAHELRIDYARSPGSGPAAIRFGMTPPAAEDPIDAAVVAAAEADVAVLIVGTDGDWETEGDDRPAMRLPCRQDELVARVAAANPRTVVVLNTGSPVEMPWIDDVPTVLQAWFAGQELGHALADVLFGDADPGGRLPTTFPRRYEDHPAFFGYPGEAGRVVYGEGVFIGYRGYDARSVAPLFPFGHGLSYTSFAYGEAELVADPSTAAAATVTVDVTNTGPRTGSEVVQLYVRPPAGPLARPPQELKGFAKLRLAPGATGTARVALDARAFAAFDPERAAWVAEPGAYELAIGSSSRDLRSVVTFVLDEAVVVPVGPGPATS